MKSNRYLIYGAGTLMLIAILLVIGNLRKPSNQASKLSVSYYSTTEGGSYHAQIEDSEIKFIHTDYESIKDKCSAWIKQAPCWTEQDLISEEAHLTALELNDLKTLIEETKILQLDSYYGPTQGERCYPYLLEVNGKEINYCSSPDSPAEPEPFHLVSKKVQDLVTQHFSK
jgi:hypothetical protein